MTNYILKNTKKDHEVLLYQEKSSYKYSPKKGYKESIEVTVLDNEMLNPLWEHKLNKEYEKLMAKYGDDYLRHIDINTNVKVKLVNEGSVMSIW